MKTDKRNFFYFPKKRLVSAAVFLALSPLPSTLSPVFAAIPQSINYQGFLVSKLTNTAVDSPQDMKFLLYDTAYGGSPLFTENRCNVSVSRGRYDVEIGSSTPGGIPASIFQNQTQGLWLEIQVDADGDCAGTYEAMQPRVRLQASPFSFNSLYASTASAGPTYSQTGTPSFRVDIIGTQDQSTNGAVTISSNLYVQGGIAVGAISPGSQLSVSGMVESVGECNNVLEEDCVCKLTGTCGFKFPDKSVQYTAAGNTMWAVANEGRDLYSIVPGNVGISTSSPQASLHVSTGLPGTWDVFRVDAGTTIVFNVTGQGRVTGKSFSGDGSALTGVNDTSRVNKSIQGPSERMYGSLTIATNSWVSVGDGLGPRAGGSVAGSSLTVADARGIIARRLEFGPNVSISSVASAASGAGQWAGIYISTNIYVNPSARIIGDGSLISGVISEDNTKVMKAGDVMTGHLMLYGSSMTIITTNTAAAPYSLAITTDADQQGWHLYLSTTGNLGLGTANLTHKLRVEGGILAASSITAQAGFYTPGPINANTITSVYGITASSGTFGSWGPTQYSIETTTGILVTHGEVYAPFFRGNGAQLTGVSGTDATKVAKAGDTMTGPLQMNAALTVTNSSVTIISTANTGAYTMVVSTVADPNYYSLVVSTRGYVGVHLANPTANLDVYRNLQVSNSLMGDSSILNLQTYAGYNYIRWADNSLYGTYNQGVLGFLAGSRNFVFRTAASDPGTGGAEVFRIKSDFEGNWTFGIGTTDPKTQLHVNADMLVGQNLSVPTLFVSTGTASVSVATTTASHKLVVNGGIIAASSVTAGAGLYGTHYGDIYTSSITVGNSKGEDAATMKIGERYGNNYTLVVGTNNSAVSYYDMVLTPDGRMGLGVNGPQAQFHTIGGIIVGGSENESAVGGYLDLYPYSGDTFLKWGEVASANKAVMGFRGGSRELTLRVADSGGNVSLNTGNEAMRISQYGGNTIIRSSLTVTGELASSGDYLMVGSGMLVVTRDGRAGINIAASAPAYTLDVNGGGVIRSSFVVAGTGLTGPQEIFRVSGLTTLDVLYAKKNGSIGMGTITPDRTLDVNGGAIVRSSFVVTGTGLTGTQTAFSVIGSTLIVRNDGFVGMGVAGPTGADRLEVNGTVRAAGYVAGWERIETTCGNPAVTCSANCSAGKKLMSGGCRISAAQFLYNSYPSADNAWTCDYNTTETSLTAYAICSTVQ